MTRIFAHRGASAERPENTPAAFARAVELGADGVELDVHLAADGTLVVHHDYELPPALPSLRACLDASADLLVNVEVKSDDAHPASRAFLDLVDAELAAWGGEVLLSSFDPGVVDHFAGRWPTAQLTVGVPDDLAAVAARGHGAWHPWAPMLTEELVAAAHAAGLAVNTWTVDDPERVAELAGWGVDGICTNDVAAALAALGR